ncbi:MAG: aminodeoxychorismate lyase [Propionibacterium sp.]|nr:aminodeoxychorismate lyase [Propionibacterium sp.]
MNVVVLLNPAHPDGELLDEAVPHFSALAQGIARGDGIFETARYAGGRVRKLDEHLWRLHRSAGLTGLDIPDDDAWRRAITTAIDAWQPTDSDDVVAGEALVKLLVMRGYAPENVEGYAWIVVSPVPATLRPTAPVKVSLLERGFSSTTAAQAPWLLLGAKTLSYATNMAAIREAQSRGAQDVIFVTSDGLVLEGPTSTVVIKRGDELVTPPNELGVLPGTTQRVLFRAAQRAGWRTSTARLTPDDLRSADAVWLTSSVRLLTQVQYVDDDEVALDDDAHATLQQLFEDAS